MMIALKKAQFWWLLLAGLTLCIYLAGESFAQSQKTKESASSQANQEQTLKALLSEIRQLRLSLEWTNFNQFRAQIIVERIRLQHDRLDRLTQQLDELRAQSADNKLNQTRLQERIKDLDSRINQERDPALRTQLESEQKEMKPLLEQQGVWEERNREREGLLTNQLQTEEGKLRRLNERLDAFEQQVESQGKPDPTP